MILLQLYFEYFKIGLFSVGGGLATVPFLQELSAKTGWFTLQELANMIAVAESTPGPIGINTATYVGYSVAGPVGGVIATLGIISPALIVGGIIASMIIKFRDSRKVKAVFSGLRPASVAMIAAAGVGVAKLVFIRGEISSAADILSAIDFKAVILALFVFGVSRIKELKNVHPIAYIGFGAAIGIIFNLAG